MKKIIYSIVLLLISTQSIAFSGVSTGGHTACFKKSWYKEAVSFVVAGDMDSFESYFDTKKCLSLKEGIKVTITESPGIFGGTTGFVFRGVKLWTAREAFEYGN